MNDMRYQKLMSCVAGLALATAAFAAAAEGSLDKNAYRAAGERIEAQAKTEKAACKTRKGMARDVCEAEAKGRERIAQARLDAEFEPGPEADRLVKEAKAETAFDLAKIRCSAARDKAKGTCVRQAKLAREAAIRQAKVEKVQAMREAQREQRQAQKQGAPSS
jgi:hypothetical protein